MKTVTRTATGPSESWRSIFLQEKLLMLAVVLTLCVSAGLFLHRNSGAWDGPQESIIRGSDDWCYYLWLPTVLDDHDVDFRNQFEAVPNWEPWVREQFLGAAPTATGLLPNKYPVGWAVASAPWYLTARVLGPKEEASRAIPSPRVEWWTLFGQWIYGLAGLAAAVVFIARFFDKATALGVVLAGWWCSPLMYYQTCALSMSHSLVFALVAFIFVLTERLRENAEGRMAWIFLGLLAGLLLSVRPPALPYLLYPGVLLGTKILREKRWSGGVFAVVAALLAFTPQLLAWKSLYGHWLTYSYGEEGFRWGHPKFLEVLISPLHGWLYWHPLMALGVVCLGLALVRGFGAERGRAGIFVLVLGLVTWLNASWETWWYGVSFGARAFEGLTLGVMFGLAWSSYRGAFPGTRILVWLAVICGLWNLNLIWLSRHWRETEIKLDEPVTYRQIITASQRFYLPAGGEKSLPPRAESGSSPP